MAGDDHRLQQAFFNVMYNAIQALEPMATRQIIVRAMAHTHVGPDHVSVQGVPIQFQDTGLGLSILMEVISGHNGVVDVASTLGVGTTFSLFIPGYRPPIKKRF